MTVARRFASNIDLLSFALVRAMLDPVTSDPTGLGTGDAGRTWYRSDVPTLKTWNGTAAVDMLARGSQTGTQIASTISDFTTAVQAIKWATMTAPTAAVNMNSQQFSSLATASSSGQAVEYAQFNTALANLKSGLDFKSTQMTVVATSNISLSAPGATISGHTMVSGDTMLLTGQTTASQNGMYNWLGASTTATRTPDASSTGSIFSGTMVAVGNAGTTSPDTVWMQTVVGTGTNGAITIGTDSMTWIQPFTATAYTSGNGGITVVGSVITAIANTGVTIGGSGIGADFSVVPKKLVSVVPTATTGLWTIATAVGTYNHGLGNYCPTVTVRVYTSPASGYTQGDEIDMYCVATDSNNVQITFPAAPASNNWIIQVVG
jgi:hypothetical protein